MTIPVTPRAVRRGGLATVTVALLAAAVLLWLPQAASASNVTCRGHISAGKPDEVNTNPVAYTFACSTPITAYTIVSDLSVDQFEPEVLVFDKGGTVVASDNFSCEGDIPGNGVNCKGTYGADQRVVTGVYDLGSRVCGPKRTSPLLVVTDDKGAMAGPFELGRPHGCARAASGKRRHSKPAARRHA